MLTEYDHRCVRIEDLGYDPRKMTLREQVELLEGEIKGKELTKLDPSKSSESYKKHEIAVEYHEYIHKDAPLIPTKFIFWVGVKAGVSISEPIRRTMTSCYAAYPVYRLPKTEELVFKTRNGYFYVPECEHWAFQEVEK